MLAWPDLRQRDRQPEWMDQPNLDPVLHDAALVGLSRLNAISGAVGMLWPPLARLAQSLRRPLRVLDLAAGGGDTLIALAKRAARDRIQVELVGCDISPQARTLALSQAARSGVSIGYETVDLLNQPLPMGFDAIICSLFLHHLDEPDIITLLHKSSEAAGRLVLINDLVRSPVSYALVWASCRIVTRSPMVHMDGPLSIRAAFTPSEFRDLAQRAGWTHSRLCVRWPARMQLQWNRPHE